MTITVNVHEAKTHLSKLLQRVVTGEEIIIARSGQPLARLVPFEPKPNRRQPGSSKADIWIAPDFDAPLPDELLAAFEGN